MSVYFAVVRAGKMQYSSKSVIGTHFPQQVNGVFDFMQASKPSGQGQLGRFKRQVGTYFEDTPDRMNVGTVG